MSEEGVFGGWRHCGPHCHHLDARGSTKGTLRHHTSSPPPGLRHLPVTAAHPKTHGRYPPHAISDPPLYPNAAQMYPNALRVTQTWIGTFTRRMGLETNPKWGDKVAEVLRDPLNKLIDFSFGELSVSPKRLNKIADAFAKGQIPIIYDPSNTQGQPGWAEYRSDIRAMIIRSTYFKDKIERSLMMHESVHALFDQEGLKRVLAIENEISAHLAQAMYCQLQDWEWEELRSRTDSSQGATMEFVHMEPFRAAWDLAEFLLGKRGSEGKLMGAKTPSADGAQYHKLVENLRATIKADPTYQPKINTFRDHSGF